MHGSPLLKMRFITALILPVVLLAAFSLGPEERKEDPSG